MAALHGTANIIKIHKLWKNNHEEEEVPLSRSRSTDLQLQVWSNLSISPPNPTTQEPTCFPPADYPPPQRETVTGEAQTNQ